MFRGILKKNHQKMKKSAIFWLQMYTLVMLFGSLLWAGCLNHSGWDHKICLHLKKNFWCLIEFIWQQPIGSNLFCLPWSVPHQIYLSAAELADSANQNNENGPTHSSWDILALRAESQFDWFHEKWLTLEHQNKQIFKALPDLDLNFSKNCQFLAKISQKSGNASFCDLPTKTNEMSSELIWEHN